MCAIGLVYTVWGKDMQRFIVLCQFIEAIRNDQADGQGFESGFFVGVNLLTVEKFKNIPAKNVVIGGSRAFTLTHLVSIREAIFHQLEHRHNALGCIFNPFDGLPAGAKLGQVDGYATADLR
ncbi:hypothetical protein D3C76_404560 [compost metagenome]